MRRSFSRLNFHRQFISKRTRGLAMLLALAAAVTGAVLSRNSRVAMAAPDRQTQGSLQIVTSNDQAQNYCPLKHTDVKAEISGFLSRVTVTQEFENPIKEKIEAVYTFPLPQNAAVDDMTMIVGERTVRGRIMRREQAEAVYEAAKTNGQVASLLNQERPNIFTQSVANILPGEKVKITISYVETLKYDNGSYEFVFPMVVGPRYVPGAPTGQQGEGFAPDTDRVPDASRITPKPAPEGMRAGHDISIDVSLDAGVPLDSLASKTHEVAIERTESTRAHVKLTDLATIPNKDFILRYDVAGRRIEDAILAHRRRTEGFFTMILQPPEKVTAEDVTPKELVFVLDTSGSMSGFPIEKAKESMKLAMDNLYPSDTFNLITFAGDEHVLFEKPVPATKENLAKAQKFLLSREGSGGTEMMKAIKAALDPSDAQDHVRIVCFMTDGYVGNDMEIIGEIQKHPNARVFGFGIGSSVNRFLLDKMAEEGRGEVEYVGLDDDGSAAAKRFHERIRSPLLTDVSIDWSGLPVTDVYPKRIPDLFSAKPVIVSGRYTGTGRGVIRLKGKTAGQDFVREIAVDLPESEPSHDVLASLWARARIDDLMSRDYNGAQQGVMKDGLQEQITQIGLNYRLMTQFTSFVAVEEMIVTDGGQPRRIDVPVEVPEGVSRQGVFGREEKEQFAGKKYAYAPTPMMQSVSVVPRTNGPPSPPPSKVKVANANRSGGGGSGGSGRAMNMSVDGVDVDARTLSPEELKQAALRARFSPVVFAVIDRLKKKNPQPAADEAKFVRDGKAEIQIWLTSKSPEVMEELKKLGFEIILDPKSATMVIGRIQIEKLAALGELKFVRYVAPQTSDR